MRLGKIFLLDRQYEVQQAYASLTSVLQLSDAVIYHYCKSLKMLRG